MVLQGDASQLYKVNNISPGHAIPSYDGKTIFTRKGLFTRDLKRLTDPVPQDRRIFLPVHSPHYYCTLEPANKPRGLAGPRLTKEEAALLVLTVFPQGGDTSPLLQVPDLSLLKPNLQKETPLPFDKHFHVIPDAELLVFIPFDCKQLILQRLKVDEALEKSGFNYLFVKSEPPAWAKRGATYTYRIVVKSKKDDVKYKLESGPKGMTVSDSGQLTWPVPADTNDNEVRAIIGIRDASGQERLHVVSPKIE